MILFKYDRVKMLKILAVMTVLAFIVRRYWSGGIILLFAVMFWFLIYRYRWVRHAWSHRRTLSSRDKWFFGIYVVWALITLNTLFQPHSIPAFIILVLLGLEYLTLSGYLTQSDSNPPKKE